MQKKAINFVWRSFDDQAIGILGSAYPIKEASASTINTLHEMGSKGFMCTGDNRKTAEAVARELGIDEVIPEVAPQDKHEIIEKLKREGAVVAMAGEGLHDAPALAAAQVGIALGTGPPVAVGHPGVTGLGELTARGTRGGSAAGNRLH